MGHFRAIRVAAAAASVIGAVTALLVTSTTVPSYTGTAAAADATTPAWDGVYAGNGGPSGIQSFEGWLGGSVHYVTEYINDTSWTYVADGVGSYLGDFGGEPYTLVLSVPMIPVGSGATLEQGAAGDFNSYFQSLGKFLVAHDESNAILRLGWELSGNWFPWSAQSDPTAFAAYWRQIVDTMRAVPGQDFQFDWNGGSAGQTGWDPTAAYPGNAYVDYISADVYDWSPEYYSNNDPTPAEVQEFWNNTVLNGTDGLNWTATFAEQNDKPMALPEWGLMYRPDDGQGGGDDTVFLQDMYNFITTHNVAYADYFDYDPGSGQGDSDLQDGNFPASESLYLQLFGPGTSASSTNRFKSSK